MLWKYFKQRPDCFRTVRLLPDSIFHHLSFLFDIWCRKPRLVIDARADWVWWVKMFLVNVHLLNSNWKLKGKFMLCDHPNRERDTVQFKQITCFIFFVLFNLRDTSYCLGLIYTLSCLQPLGCYLNPLFILCFSHHKLWMNN